MTIPTELRVCSNGGLADRLRARLAGGCVNLDLILESLARIVEAAGLPLHPINIIFTGPPGPEMPQFVEVETDDGKSIKAGEWIERGDGLWALRITELPTVKV